ncbi:MAG: lipoyl(octanoyl) transferase LipB [Candidatus Omnitrophica bacterium]|nr:lipoyl(octanoyl) transferase LipB [Candidatus Omnitrophota bacterium]
MIIDLGLIGYTEAYGIQKELVNKRRRREIGDSLILAEHPPIFTIGRLGSIENLIKNNGVTVLRVDRGGDITFHGPGQLVLYPIVNLKDNALDLHKYMRLLESAAITFLRQYSVEAKKIEKRTGVWVDGKKIASIGIAASGWVTYHGMSVNLNVDLEYFSMIYPCGMKDVMATSLDRVIGRKISIEDAKRAFSVILNNIIDFGEGTNAGVKYESAMA